MNDRSVAVDFHVHTKYSFDSVTPPKLAIEMARRRGLDGIAVTDHDTIAGAIAACEANRYDDFLVIPGIEVKSDRGDVIGLYVKEEIRSRAFADVIDEIKSQGGLVYIPHPIRTFGCANVEHVHAGFPQIDLWERYNGRYGERDFVKSDAIFGELEIDAALCGSDAHFPWEIGLLRTLLDDLPRGPASLLALQAEAALCATPRGELPLRTGIALGEAIKTFKRGHYLRFGTLIASLPIRALRRALRPLSP